jgi:multidrug efflux pump subunit AcrA (membrane-fusion protein)
MHPNSALRAGIFASALIDTEHSCGIAVPRSAIVRQNDTVSVQVLKAGRVETRRVRVGLSSEDNVEIREGLAEGESVITNAGVAF